MTIMRTRIGGWPVTIIKQQNSAAIARVRDDAGLVPESLRTIHLGSADDWLQQVSFGLVSDINQWVADFMWHYPQHTLSHSPEDEGHCNECWYGVQVALRQQRPATEDPWEPEPLPQVYVDDPLWRHAVWHKGRRVTSMSDYYTTGKAESGDLVHWCHVEALSTTGEILCATARVDEITHWAYRPVGVTT